LNAILGISLANNLPGWTSQRVCVLHTFPGLAGVVVVAEVLLEVDSFTAAAGGVRAGKIDEVVEGFDGGDGATITAVGGLVWGGMPGGRGFIDGGIPGGRGFIAGGIPGGRLTFIGGRLVGI